MRSLHILSWALFSFLIAWCIPWCHGFWILLAAFLGILEPFFDTIDFDDELIEPRHEHCYCSSIILLKQVSSAQSNGQRALLR